MHLGPFSEDTIIIAGQDTLSIKAACSPASCTHYVHDDVRVLRIRRYVYDASDVARLKVL